MKTMLKLGLVLLVAGAGYAGWRFYAGEQEAAPPRTYAVTQGHVESTVLASGVVQPKSLVSVGARVSGRIEQLAVRLGDEVREGDLIAQIDKLDQENALAQARAELANIDAQIASARAALRLAGTTRDRQQRLWDQRATSREDYETAEADLESRQAELEALEAQRHQAETAVSSAELDLDRTRIVSPLTGTVVAVVVQEGQTVNATQSAPTIVKVANLDNMEVSAEISEADVMRVAPGQRVYFSTLGAPDRKIDGALSFIEPAPDTVVDADVPDTESAVYYNGIFDVDNSDRRLRMWMTAEVTIVLDEAGGVLTLPAAAVGTPGPDGRYAMQVYDPATGRYESRDVTLGLVTSISAEVVDGLAEGERVVAPGLVPAGTAAQGGRRGPPRMMGF